MIVFKLILAALIGYLVGCINPSYIIGRLRGFDIREKGSGNAGASNAMIVMGKAVGAFSAVFDILKAAAIMWLAPVLFKNTFAVAEVAGACCILGHIHPVFMKFKGGKGLACLGGAFLAIDWRLTIVILVVEVGAALLFDYICVMPLSASVLLPLLYGILGDGGFGILLRGTAGWWGAAAFGVVGVFIVLKHRENLQRIRENRELHLSYLWSKDKDAEIARVTAPRDN